MDEIKIEKGIPVPSARNGNGGEGLTALFRPMEIGDSVLIKNKRQQELSGRLAWLRPRKYATRVVEGGVRVWRVA